MRRDDPISISTVAPSQENHVEYLKYPLVLVDIRDRRVDMRNIGDIKVTNTADQ